MFNVTAAQLQSQGAVVESNPAQRIQRWSLSKPDGLTQTIILDSEANKAVRVEGAEGAAMLAVACAAILVDAIQASALLPATKTEKIKVIADALEYL